MPASRDDRCLLLWHTLLLFERSDPIHNCDLARNAETNLLDDGIDRHLWIIRLREKIPLFSTLRWGKQSLMLKGLDSVVTGISTFGPIVSWLFRDIRNPGNGLHILQTKFYGHQQTEWCSMIHSKGLTVEVCGEQRLWMAGCRQVERHKIRVRISRGIEIDRRFHTRPFSLRHRWVGAKQIIESQTRPPCDRTPSFDANQPRNLLMHRKASQEIPNIERDAQAISEPIQSQIPSRNIARIRSSSVVVVLERGNLRFGVGGHSTTSRVKCFRHVIIDTQCLVQNPVLPRGVHISTHTQATERILWQEKSTAC